MTGYKQPSSCLSPEALALIAGGKLPAAEREQAEAHLSTCADCYDVLMELAETASVSLADNRAGGLPAEGVLSRRSAKKPIIVWSRSITVWSSIAAAALVAAFVAPRFLQGPDRELGAAVGTLAKSVGTERPTIGRLNGGFEWGAPRAVTRGDGATDLPLAVQDAVLAVKKLAAATKTAKTMDALGVAHLVAGDLAASLSALDAAVALDPKDPAARADLAAARLEQWRRTQAPVDATSALDAAQYALLLTPKDAVARFNHALSVEALGLTAQAIESWKAYLALDANSKWADEARAHLTRLGSGTAGGLPADTGRDRYVPDLAAAIAAEKDPARLDCLARGRQAIADSRAAFDASRTAESERLAQTAKTAFICGRVPTFEADAQIFWTHYFLGTASESPRLNVFIDQATQRGYLRAAGRVQYARGRLADNAARYSDAEELFGQALDLFERAGDIELIVSTRVQMAEITNDFGDAARTWDRLSTPLRALPALAPRRQHMALTGAYLAANRQGMDGASQFFADALVRADERNSTDPVLLAGANLQSARASLQFGDVAGAAARLSKARDAQTRIGDGALRTQFDAEIDELEGRIFVDADPPRAIRALTGAMDTFGAAGRPLRRAKLLLIRGRAYRAAGDAAAAEKDWCEGAAVFEDQRPEIRDAQQQIDHFDQLWDLFRELMAVRVPDGVGSLEVAERFRGRALLDAMTRDKQSRPLAGEAMYRWLPAGVTVLAYAVLPEQLLRWTISRDRVVLEQVRISSTDLTSLVDRHRATIARRGDVGDADAVRLSQVLLPGFLDTGTKRLVFLPDGPLFSVPFAALPLPGGSSRLVVDDFITSIAPSLTVLKNGAKSAVPTKALLIAAADAHAAESLPALPGATAEIRAIAPAYRDLTMLQGAAATPKSILDALPSAGVMHFAGHAVADSASPSRSRLLVSGSSVVSFDDLRHARLRPGAIIVLSACDAARGRVFHGEGAVGLTYPFLANGASAVVASIWQIDDATPVSLWQSFHARVSVGAATDVALAESQRMSRRQGVAPAVWAAFESVGGLARQ
jgi:tetratricopeptide (TPR) repeat protein